MTENHGFEAPAIEEWLVEGLQPPRNTVIKGRALKHARKKAEKELIRCHKKEYDDLVAYYSVEDTQSP